MENKIKTNNCLIFFYSFEIEKDYDARDVLDNFCGEISTIFYNQEMRANLYSSYDNIYVCGELREIELPRDRFKVIREMSANQIYDYDYISIGDVPILIKDIGIFYRGDIFRKSPFKEISAAHKFQTLTESNKPGQAYRTGIYLSEVIQSCSTTLNELQFNLLRCSTNFAGPTENFADIDRSIIARANEFAARDFQEKIHFNHVLAQIYHNSVVENKAKKAKIKEHSDKRTDMARAGLIAFCSFYDLDEEFIDKDNNVEVDFFDISYKNISILTKLRFRLKKSVENRAGLQEVVDVALFPNSMLIIPLSTNRLYTHEIIPSQLSIDKIPTRMGYVIRCSDTLAIHKNDKTYIDGKEMHAPAAGEIKMLKEKYAEENRESHIINYDKIWFSLNSGDYLAPIL